MEHIMEYIPLRGSSEVFKITWFSYADMSTLERCLSYFYQWLSTLLLSEILK